MPNAYLELLERARKLPAAYAAMGTSSRRYVDTRNQTVVSGWVVCQFLYKMNRDGDEWWSNDFNLLVDESGQLWELLLAEEYSPYEGGRQSHVNLDPVNGEKLRVWDVNGWDFPKMKRSVEAMA